jgi:perosamine synthetase
LITGGCSFAGIISSTRQLQQEFIMNKTVKIIDNKPSEFNNSATDRVIQVYNQAIRKNFYFLKQTSRLDELFSRSIPLEDGKGFLVPICELYIKDDEIIAKLAKWRAENAFAYPTQFPVTMSGTKFWLRSKLLDVEDRILFLVLDKFGNIIGHLGFANAINDRRDIEIDNVIRGVKDVQPGIMTSAMKTLMDWAEETIGPDTIYLRVMNDNHHAIEFYRKLGFVDNQLIPLRRYEDDERIEYRTLTEDDHNEPDKYFLRMKYVPNRIIDTSKMILTAGPSISVREVSYAIDAARYGWNQKWNVYIKRFEASFAEYLEIKYALSTSCCTGAMHLALLALGIGPGDEVIVPDITWVATANAVVYVGATPIFADIEPDSWCLDPNSFEKLINERTRAVMPVHLYGHPARMDKITEIARKHNLYVIEDAAPAIGAEFKGQKTGTFGDFAAFSFQGAKLVVTGEGGVLVTNNDELYRRVYSLWDQGRTPGTFWINEIGWKYKMSNIQAAIGLGQLERVDELIEAKRRIFSWYAEGLQNVPYIKLNQEMPWARSIYWMTSIILDENATVTRDELRDALKEQNIDTRLVFPAISQYPIWPKPQQTQPIAYKVGNRALNLPSGVCLKHEQVYYICQCIKEILT